MSDGKGREVEGRVVRLVDCEIGEVASGRDRHVASGRGELDEITGASVDVDVSIVVGDTVVEVVVETAVSIAVAAV